MSTLMLLDDVTSPMKQIFCQLNQYLAEAIVFRGVSGKGHPCNRKPERTCLEIRGQVS